MADELQKHLDSALYGTPQINPEEQKQYLGTFRERCYLSMTMEQMQDKYWQQTFIDHLADYPDAEIRINGNLPETLQSSYLQICTKMKRTFHIIQTNASPTLQTIGLLVVSTQAVDEEVIDISQKWPQTMPSASQPKPKTSLFKKWLPF